MVTTRVKPRGPSYICLQACTYTPTCFGKHVLANDKRIQVEVTFASALLLKHVYMFDKRCRRMLSDITHLLFIRMYLEYRHLMIRPPLYI
jgi:hypothetical protein